MWKTPVNGFHSVSERHNRDVTQPYVPLRVFSSFTMLEGAMEPKTIAERAREARLPGGRAHRPQRALRGDAVQRRLRAKGVQPIIGAMLGGGPAARDRRQGAASTGWCCWPRTRRATPISASWSRRRTSTGPSSRTRTSPFAALEGASEGLIALTAGGEGALARLLADGQQDKAADLSRPAAGAVPRPAVHRAHPPRRSGRGGRRRGADRPRLRARPAARRDQSRPLTPTRASTPRTTPCCASPIRPTSKAPSA